MATNVIESPGKGLAKGQTTQEAWDVLALLAAV